MKSPTKRLLAIVTTCAIFALAYAALTFSRRPHISEGNVSLFFLGYTNHPSLGVNGVFLLTNGHPYHIAYVPAFPEIRTNGVWSRSGRARTASEMPIDSPTVAPAGTAVFLMQKPQGSNCWRVLVGCVKRDASERLAKSVYLRLPHDRNRVTGSLAGSRIVQYISSPEIPE